MFLVNFEKVGSLKLKIGVIQFIKFLITIFLEKYSILKHKIIGSENNLP